LLINDKIIFKNLQINMPDNQTEIVGITAQIGGEEVDIYSIYHPPGAEHTYDNIQQILTNNRRVVVGGDFNAKNKNWGARSSTKKGKEIEIISNEASATIAAPLAATSVPHNTKQGDIIDFYILKNMTSSVPETVYELTSDHYPVKIEIAAYVTRLKQTTKPNWVKYTYHHRNI
jgi:endonuclease/exonuclease/phosphatase family metal-dependent hydrolase